jgi:hypothetical protein
LIDDPTRLQQLYVTDGLSIREIASEYAEVSHTRLCEALHEHDIIGEADSPNATSMPNTDVTADGTTTPDWSRLAD